MQTAGEFLKQARINSKLTFTQISKITKIPVRTIQAIEKNQLSKLPSSTYIIGFIKNYAQVVDLNSEKIVAIFKRDYQRQKKKNIIPQGLTKPLNTKLTGSDPVKTIIAASLAGALLLSYLAIAFFKLNQPPRLVITQPENGQTLTSPILIKGKTNHDATLTLNGKTINLESDGSFTTVYNGPQGTVELKLKATSRRDKSTEESRHVIISE
ncbi:helix-turn-helix domain-containing protein [Patescibacteria group bacterium]